MKSGWFWKTSGVAAVVGGLVHILQPIGFNLLSFFGSYAGWVQFIAGALTVAFAFKFFPTKKRR